MSNKIGLYTRFREFVWRNQVWIVTVPMIAGLHYSWLRLQKAPGVVGPGEETATLPFEKIYNMFCKGATRLSNKITGTEEVTFEEEQPIRRRK